MPKDDKGLSPFERERQANKIVEDKFMAELKAIRPEIWVLADILDQTQINPFVVWKVIYAMNGVATGSGWGQIIVEVQDKTVKLVKGVEQTKVEEPLLLKK